MLVVSDRMKLRKFKRKPLFCIELSCFAAEKKGLWHNSCYYDKRIKVLGHLGTKFTKYFQYPTD